MGLRQLLLASAALFSVGVPVAASAQAVGPARPHGGQGTHGGAPNGGAPPR